MDIAPHESLGTVRDEWVAVAFVAAGVPENGGRLFAAEAVTSNPDGSRTSFTLRWVAGRATPEELWRNSGERKREKEVATEEELLAALRAWLRGRPCWSLDASTATRWLGHHRNTTEPKVPVLDLVLASQWLSRGSDAATAADVARQLGRVKRADRPAGSFRAAEVLTCLEGLASTFAQRAQERPAWARLVMDCLEVRGHGDLAVIAGQLRRVLQSSGSLLLPPTDLRFEPVLPEDREALARQALSAPAPAWTTSYVTTDRPQASGRELTGPGLLDTLRSVFVADLPALFGKELAGTVQLEKERAQTRVEDVAPEPIQPALVPGLQPDVREKSHRSEQEERERAARQRLTVRPGQLTMARHVARAVLEGEVLLAEAETGTGKTLAYLVPGIVTAVQRRQRVIVSTYSRALQDQIAARDAQNAIAALTGGGHIERHPQVTVIKGASNYVCLPALVDALAERPARCDEAIAQLMALTTAVLDRYGELPDVPLRPELTDAVKRLTARVRSTGRCRHRRSDLVRCPYDLAQDSAGKADVVIGNHAWLLSTGIGDTDVLIVDEADQLPGQAEERFAVECKPAEIETWATDLVDGRDSVLERLARLHPKPEDDAALEARIRLVAADLRRIAAGLKKAASSWANLQQKPKVDGGVEEFEFRNALRATDGGKSLLSACAEANATFAQLPELLRAVGESAGRAPSRMARTQRAVERQVSDLLRTSGEALDVMKLFSDGGASENFTLLLKRHRWGWQFTCEPLLVGPLLKQRFRAVRALVFSSASLSVGGDMTLFRARSGVTDLSRDRERIVELRLPSPFDYANTMTVGVAMDVPREGPPHGEFLAKAIVFTAQRTRGRLLALFTSKKEMEEVFEIVQPQLEPLGIPVYKAVGETANAVAARFRAEVHSVALGVRSFWYGVDFPGETLEWLFVSKVPYEHFTANLRRREAAQQVYAIAPDDYYKWSAMLMLKQGLGRVVRRSTDRGTAIVFDPWLAKPPLQDLLKQILPEGTSAADTASRPVLRFGPLGDLLEDAFARHKIVSDLEARGLSVRFGADSAAAGSGTRESFDSSAIDRAATLFAQGDVDEAWTELQPIAESCARQAGTSEPAARGALLAAKILLAMNDGPTARRYLEPLCVVSRRSTALAAWRLLFAVLSGASSAGEFWREPSAVADELMALLPEAARFDSEDATLAGWRAVLAWGAPEPPITPVVALAKVEDDADWSLAAYVTCLHAVRVGAYLPPAAASAVIRESASRFGVPISALAEVVYACATSPDSEIFSEAVGAVLDAVSSEEMLTLDDTELLELGESAAAAGRQGLLEQLVAEVERRLDEHGGSPERVHRVLALRMKLLEMVIGAGRRVELARKMQQLTAFAEGYGLQERGAKALEVLAQPGVPREVARESTFARARLLGQSGDGGVGMAVALLSEEASRCLASADYEWARTAVDEIWLLSPQSAAVLDLDQRLRRASPELAPAEARAATLGSGVPPGRYLIVGGDHALETRVRERLPAHADIVWIPCERGQRPQYERVDDLLTAGRFQRVVPLTHHISHALSNHVTRKASRLGPGVLAFPALPGMQGVIRALSAEGQSVH